MHFAMTDEQKMLVDAVRQTLETRAPLDTVRKWLSEGDSGEFHQLLVRGGWGSVGIPEHVGGQGGSFEEITLIAEEFGRAASPSGTWMASTLTFPAIEAAPDLARALAEGHTHGAWAVPAAEPQARCWESVRTGQQSDTLTGEVKYVLAGAETRWFLVPAHTESSTQVYVVDGEAPGVTIHARPMLDRSRQLVDLTLENASVRNLSLDDPTSAVSEFWRRAAVLTAADALGCARRMLEMTVTYVGQREQFGVPVGTFQAVQHAAAQMRVDIEPLESIVRYAAWAIKMGESDADLHAYVAKTHAPEAAARVADSALLLHGAIGFTWEHDLQLYYKRAKLDQELFGSASNWRRLTAEALELTPADEGTGA